MEFELEIILIIISYNSKLSEKYEGTDYRLCACKGDSAV
jgi:hypothetical protein